MGFRRGLPILFAAALLPAALAAQPKPISGTFQISPPFLPPDPSVLRFLGEPAATALASGGFAVAWDVRDSLGCCDFSGSGIDGRLVSFAAQPGAELHAQQNTDPSLGTGCPALAATGVAGTPGAGGLRLAHLQLQEPNSVVEAWRLGAAARLFRTDGNVGLAAAADDDDCPALAASPSGRYVIAWPRFHAGDSPATYFVRAFDASDQPLGPPLALDAPLAVADERPPAVGMDAQGGFVVAWRGGGAPGIFARRFAADGSPAGPPIPIVTSYADGPLLSLAPDGGFTVVYTKPAAAGAGHALVLRRFASDGTPLGTPVSPATVGTLLAASTDRYGSFALSWLDGARHTRVQVFDRTLAAHGGAVDVALPVPAGVTPAESAIALADSGRLLVTWSDGSIVAAQPFAVRGRLWQALRPAGFCAYRGNRLLCDTAASGLATVSTAFGAGLATDVPLLGDVDGDGRLDLCIVRGNRFACDTARNGGTAEVKIDFGQPGDQPLLADVDGDGRADPCVHRGNRFLCDTRHDGSTAEVRIAFGVASDVALLGDVDGDGRADPCVYRGGVFLCDTAHDGVLAETRLDLRPALGGATEGVPLLGDIDGDGRADACLYRAGTLTCGLFEKAGGLPFAVVVRPTFGEAGDVPLLGYMGPS